MKINDKSQTYIVLAIIIFAFYYLVIKPASKGITDVIGITDSADTKAVEKEVQNIKSPFSESLWRNYFYKAPATPNGRQKLSGVFQLAAPKMVRDLKKCFGILSDNEKAVFVFFARFKTQCEISFFAACFNEIMKKDLLSFLREGFNALPQNGISDANVNKIIKAANKLPLK